MIGIGRIILLAISGHHSTENYMTISKKWVRCFCNEIRNQVNKSFSKSLFMFNVQNLIKQYYIPSSLSRSWREKDVKNSNITCNLGA